MGKNDNNKKKMIPPPKKIKQANLQLRSDARYFLILLNQYPSSIFRYEKQHHTERGQWGWDWVSVSARGWGVRTRGYVSKEL